LKYWRGYLTAAIFGFISWALVEFAKSHDQLIDMIYPYVTRMVQTFLAEWSSGTDLLLWQFILLVLGIVVLASVVLMIVMRWNPIQWLGWVAAGAAIIFTLHIGIYGMNNYAGPLSDDIRLEETDYTLAQLEEAAAYYRDKANDLAGKVKRNPDGSVDFMDFDMMTTVAGAGFQSLVYDDYLSVFAGSLLPVKELGWADAFTSAGITNLHIPLTGEAAVNPQTPEVAMPFTICKALVNRMCISIDRDALFAAYLACNANYSPEFQYSANFMAYYYCYTAMRDMNTIPSNAAMIRVNGEVNAQLRKDLDSYSAFFDENMDPEKTALADKAGAILKDKDFNVVGNVTDLLVSWHIQEVVIPSQVAETIPFNPLDESQVDLTVIPTPTEEVAEEK
jgi:hypothetical protein